MKLQGKKLVLAFTRKHSSSRAAFNRWISTIKGADLNNHVELKELFSSADYVQDRKVYVFNVGGNNYRIIAKVSFIEHIVRVEEVMTHAEYDNW